MNDSLMFTLYGFIFAGPFLLAIADAVALHLRFKVALLRTVFIFIIVNFLFVGLFELTLKSNNQGFSIFGLQPPISSLLWFLLSCLVGFFGAAFILYLPFCYLSSYSISPLKGSLLRKRLKDSTKMSAVAAATTALVFALCFFQVFDASILSLSLQKKYVSLLPPLKSTLYFIADGQVMKGSLLLGDFSPIMAASPGSELTLDPAKQDVHLTLNGADVQTVEHLAKLHRPKIENDGDLAVLVNYKDQPEIRTEPLIGLSTPFIRWVPGRENIFPTGEILTGLGGHIILFNFQKQQIAFVADGTSPLLVLED